MSENNFLEQGYQFLQEQQFKAAKVCFDRALKEEPKNANAYWGLMLATRQCKDTQQLYTRLAVPIGKNSDYKRAMENASPEQKAFFQKTEQLVMLACHKRVLQNFLEGKTFFVSKWIGHYDEAEVDQKPFSAEHTYIAQCLRTKKKADTKKLLLSVYEKCKALPDLGDQAFVDSVMQFVRQEYAACMAGLLADIHNGINSVPTAQLSGWADPLSAVTDGLEVRPDADLGLDGQPATAAERYIALAAQLSEKHSTREAHLCVNFCYKMALELDHKAEYISLRDSFYEKAAMRPGATTEEINDVIIWAPNISRYRWQYVLAATNNLTKKLTSYQKDQRVAAFLQKSRDSYEQRECEAIVYEQLTLIEKATAEYKYFLEPLQHQVERAGDDAGPEEKQKMESLWAQYLKETEEDRKRNIAAIEDRISQIKEKNQADDKAGKQGATRKGLIQVLVSVLLLALSIPVYFAIAYTRTDAKQLLDHSVLAVYLIGLGVIAVVAALQIGITKRFCDAYQKKYQLPAFFRGVVKGANVIAKVLTVASVAFIVYCAIMFPKNAGTISIKSAKDLQYIKNAPGCTFSLEEDIDLTDAPAFYLGTFRGVLEGNGHSIGNIDLKDNYWIGTNSGTIKNLTLHDITAENALINKNSGTLENLTLKAITVSVNEKMAPGNTALFVNKNTKNGKLSACKISKSNFSFAFSEKLSGNSCSIGGLVSTNEGSLTGCSISATIQGEATFGSENKYLYFGALAAKSPEIYGCSASGETTLKLTDTMSAGDISKPNFYLQVGGLLGEGEVYQSFFNGNLTVAYSVGTTKHRVMDMDQEYNIGGLVGQGKTKNSYSSGKLNVTVENTNDDVVGRICRIGSLVGCGYGTPWVENCYTNMTCKLKLDGSDYDGTSMVGGAYQAYKDVILNSFVYPKKKVTAQKITRTNRGSISEMSTKNCYCASGYNYDTHWSLNECEEMSASKIKKEKFILKTLGWDPEIWKVKNGKLPTLKPYVAPEATE